MPTNVFFAALVANFVFLATGAIELGFSLIVRSQMFNKPQDGKTAVLYLLYQSFPLTAGIANASFTLAASLFTLAGLLSPVRWLLKASGYMVMLSGLFTMCLGVSLWIMTLRIKEAFFPTYLAQTSSVQQLVQASFGCCGYFNQTTPAFVTDAICPSPAAAALLRGCATSISSFSNGVLDNIFTSVFGMVGVNFVLILAIACLLKERKERARYHHIDEKSGYLQF